MRSRAIACRADTHLTWRNDRVTERRRGHQQDVQSPQHHSSPRLVDRLHAIALNCDAFVRATERSRRAPPCPRAAVSDLFRRPVYTGRRPKQPGNAIDERLPDMAQNSVETGRVGCSRCRGRCRHTHWGHRDHLMRRRKVRLPGAGTSRQYDRQGCGDNHGTTEFADTHHRCPLHDILKEAASRQLLHGICGYGPQARPRARLAVRPRFSKDPETTRPIPRSQARCARLRAPQRTRLRDLHRVVSDLPSVQLAASSRRNSVITSCVREHEDTR